MSIHRLEETVYAGQAISKAAKALILVHGRGATPQSILPLADALAANDFALVAPKASQNRWYPEAFIRPKAQNEPDLSSALGLLKALIAQLNETGIATEKIILAGFSQGACLAGEFMAQNPGRYGGLMMFSGGLIGLGPTVSSSLYSGSLAGTPVFMGCSDRDFHIALDRFEKSGQILSELGADVNLKVYPGMDHTIIPEEISEAKKIIAGLRS